MRVPFAIVPAFIHDVSHLWLLYTCALILALGEAIYAPVRMAAVPGIVKQESLLYVNAIEQVLVGFVLVAGSSTGGVISYYFHHEVLFLLDGLTFILSVLFLKNIKQHTVRFRKSTSKHALSPKRIPVAKWITGSAILLVFLFIEITMPLANGIDNVLISVYALDIFKMGDLGVGLMYSMLGLGFVGSSFFSHLFRKKLVVTLCLFIVLEGAGHMLLSTSRAFSAALVIACGITLTGGISNICQHTLIMKIVPQANQGTFFGLMQMFSNTMMGIMMGAAGLLLEFFHPRSLSLLVGIFYVLLACIYGYMFTRIDWRKEKRQLLRNST
ncbi:MFS transporter [Virgibacillus halophilus]|uniref:MFS transporter n=1 Tax=Tigheibacillus halophilus TaxID=361280 RepID=A0ABU5C6S4_9BACI|nr:MFS transporter [Virgibacillus halophilus]